MWYMCMYSYVHLAMHVQRLEVDIRHLLLLIYISVFDKELLMNVEAVNASQLRRQSPGIFLSPLLGWGVPLVCPEFYMDMRVWTYVLIFKQQAHGWLNLQASPSTIFLSHNFVLPIVVMLKHSGEDVSYQYSPGLVEMTDHWKWQIGRRALKQAIYHTSDKNQVDPQMISGNDLDNWG